ncbi:MAG: hypothetical protein KC417_08265, partial [Myxococcales bacterium]|nr:hypothetical protein [Myxococcales bacterium]
DSGRDGGEACTPSSAVCMEDVARVCAEDGSSYRELTCDTGCANGKCNPIRFDMGWSVHQFNLANDPITTSAEYTFENDGLVTVQNANPMASVYLYDTELPKAYSVAGRFSVETASDDDLIGFVYGWQDPEHFYLLDWKKFAQNDGTCGLADEGAALHLVDAASEIVDCTDLWKSEGTDNVTPLVPTSTNPDGWDSDVDYDFVLTVRPGMARIVIKAGDTTVVSAESTDAHYTNGKFGFYNYSQAAVRYEFFTITPID